MSILIFIAILVALIWVHELGHFSVAKLFKIRVDEFAIGFPPRLFTVRYGETQYSFNLLLVGGYVSIYGEDPSSAEATEGTASLANRSRLVQAAVLVAGVAFNVLFAWLLLAGGYMYGLPAVPGNNSFGEVSNAAPTFVHVMPKSPAERAGLKAGDTVRFVQTGTTEMQTNATAREVHAFLTAHQDESFVIGVTQNDEEKNVVVRAEEGVIEGRKALGVQLEDVGTLKLPPHLALLESAVMGKHLLVAQVQGLGSLIGSTFKGEANLDDVAGPIGIATVGGEAVRQGFADILFLTVVISLNLAIVNLLPIPGLDGGRLLFVIIESVIRRPISKTLATYLTLAGFALIVTLMIVISISDISKLVG